MRARPPFFGNCHLVVPLKLRAVLEQDLVFKGPYTAQGPKTDKAGHCRLRKSRRTILCKILYYTILYYTILYYTILYYTILYYTILYYTMLCYAMLCYAMLCYAMLCYTILYYTILYYTILY